MLDNGPAISCGIRGGLASCYGQRLPNAHNVYSQRKECTNAGEACSVRGVKYQCFARSGSGLSNWGEAWLPSTDKACHGESNRSHPDDLCLDLLKVRSDSHLTQSESTAAEMGPSCLGSARVFPNGSARALEVVQGISDPYPHYTRLVSAMWFLSIALPRSNTDDVFADFKCLHGRSNKFHWNS